MIYLLEGPDGVGKTTLANAIAAKTKGHILHCSWNKDWNMRDYFTTVMDAAIALSEYQDVIIDRWVPSEFIYGNVFRGGPQSDMSDLVETYINRAPIAWIYCRNDNAVENHFKNMEKRDEMFNDMTQIVRDFDDYVHYTTNNWIRIPWIIYDYDKLNMNDFVRDLINEVSR